MNDPTYQFLNLQLVTIQSHLVKALSHYVRNSSKCRTPGVIFITYPIFSCAMISNQPTTEVQIQTT